MDKDTDDIGLSLTQLDAALKLWHSDRLHFHERVIAEVLSPARVDADPRGPSIRAECLAYALATLFRRSKSKPT